MGTKITPNGVVLLIEHEEKTYHCYLQNDFERFKTFGNFDLDMGTLVIFDESFNLIPNFPEELYDKMEELIFKYVVEENDQDDS